MNSWLVFKANSGICHVVKTYGTQQIIAKDHPFLRRNQLITFDDKQSRWHSFTFNYRFIERCTFIAVLRAFLGLLSVRWRSNETLGERLLTDFNSRFTPRREADLQNGWKAELSSLLTT